MPGELYRFQRVTVEQQPEPISHQYVDPDPSVAAALGRHHSLATALADLVDNSLDKQAKHILVRILERKGHVSGLLVIDDGDGMDDETLTRAMEYARRRDYGATDLGHFGIGLKAASLSQAEKLYVWSRREGSTAVGRSIERATIEHRPVVDTYGQGTAQNRLDSLALDFSLNHGTVVEWRQVRGFLRVMDQDEQRAWLEQTLEDLRVHLGLVFHRILARQRVRLELDVLDEDYAQLGTVPRSVTPLDPFAHRVSGLPAYPQKLFIALDDEVGTAFLHIWPDATADPGWALGGRSPLQSQGLYIYRRDRLLQAGGWNELTSPSRELSTARVSVDLRAPLENHVTINPEKTGVVFDASSIDAWLRARTEQGTDFADYLERTRSNTRTLRRRAPKPITVAEPGRGLPVDVIDAVRGNAVLSSENPVDIRWRNMTENEVFRMDRENHTIWLNVRHRYALGGTGSLQDDDAPVTKLLILLLLGHQASRTSAGPRGNREEAAWQAMLLAAVRAQQQIQSPEIQDETTNGGN